jgi:hypothetical protein
VIRSVPRPSLRTAAALVALGALVVGLVVWRVVAAHSSSVLLSRGRPASASSSSDQSLYPASAAVDGDPATRWASVHADPQWLRVDLGAIAKITSIELAWESGAYATSFKLQVSRDGQVWTTMWSTSAGTGGTRTVDVEASGRYVRMLGSARANTEDGYSLWDFSVFGSGGAVGAAGAGPVTPRPTGTVRSAKKGATLRSFGGMDRAVPDSGVSWYYNWSSTGVSIPGTAKVEFVPMMWGARSVTGPALASAAATGKVLLGFNEPDIPGQANMSVEQALSLWPQLEGTGMKLVSPVVARGAAVDGSWLDRFMSGAAERGFRVDAIALHWYGSDFDTENAINQLRGYLTSVHDRYHKPIWLTEFSLKRFRPTVTPTPDQQVAFLTRATAMLESTPFVERYAWQSFPAPTEGGLGTGLYFPDGSATPMGEAYRSAGPS